jgi:hypothetical protein
MPAYEGWFRQTNWNIKNCLMPSEVLDVEQQNAEQRKSPQDV